MKPVVYTGDGTSSRDIETGLAATGTVWVKPSPSYLEQVLTNLKGFDSGQLTVVGEELLLLMKSKQGSTGV